EPGRAKIMPLGGSPDDVTTMPTNSLKRRPVKKIKFNDLVQCTDDGKLYRYTDSGFQQEDNSGLLQQVKARDDAEYAAAVKKNSNRIEAAAKDKTEMKKHQRYGQPHNSEDQAAKDKADMDKHRPPTCSDCGHEKAKGVTGRYCQSCQKKRD